MARPILYSRGTRGSGGRKWPRGDRARRAVGCGSGESLLRGRGWQVNLVKNVPHYGANRGGGRGAGPSKDQEVCRNRPAGRNPVSFAHDAPSAQLHSIHPGGAGFVARAIDQEHANPGKRCCWNLKRRAFPRTVAPEAFRRATVPSVRPPGDVLEHSLYTLCSLRAAGILTSTECS
jgi:hypothetical protein